MANTDLLNCPEQLQKVINNISDFCAQVKMAEAQMKFIQNLIDQGYDAQFIQDSVIIYSKKGNKNEKENCFF